MTGIKHMAGSPASRKLIWLLGACVIAAGMTYAASHLVFCLAPITTDENSYIFQAHNFLEGRLVRPFPSVYARVLNQKHITFNEEIGLFSRYAPGHVLWLIPGIILGDPYLMSAFGAAIALLLMAKCGSRLGISFGTIAFLLVCSPCFIMTFGTLLSHTSGLVASSLMLLSYVLWRQTGSIKFAILAGLAWGWLFHNRTLTALCIAVPFGVDALVRLLISRRKKDAAGTFAFALAAAVSAMLLLAYNYAVVGNPLTMTHAFYDKSEVLGFGPRHKSGFIIDHDLANGLKYLAKNVKLMNLWLFGFRGSLILMAALAVIGWSAAWTPLFIGSTVCVWLGYILFWYPGPDQTGPGYYFETLPFILMAGGLGLNRLWSRFARFPRQRLAVTIVFACLLVMTAGSFMFISGKELRADLIERGRMLALYRKAPPNSLIFVEDGPLQDYGVCNPHGQDSDPLTVRSLYGANKAVIKHFPDRHPFLLTKKEQSFFLQPVDTNITYHLTIPACSTGYRIGTNVWHENTRVRVAQSGKHKRGWFAFGRRAYVFPGRFIVHYDLEVSGCPSNTSACALDVTIDGGRRILAGKEIVGATPDGVELEFEVDDFYPVEPRVFYNGCGDMVLRSIHVWEVSE